MPLAALIIEVITAQSLGGKDVIRVVMTQQSATLLSVTEQVVTAMSSIET